MTEGIFEQKVTIFRALYLRERRRPLCFCSHGFIAMVLLRRLNIQKNRKKFFYKEINCLNFGLYLNNSTFSLTFLIMEQ